MFILYLNIKLTVHLLWVQKYFKIFYLKSNHLLIKCDQRLFPFQSWPVVLYHDYLEISMSCKGGLQSLENLKLQ